MVTPLIRVDQVKLVVFTGEALDLLEGLSHDILFLHPSVPFFR